MSSQETGLPQTRAALVEAATQAIYENSTATVFFHTAIAEKVGLGATEEKTLLMLSEGPRTAGEIAQYTGLTTGSVTSLIDRMEKKGFVRRVRDAGDRRRVIVEADAGQLEQLAGIFGTFQPGFEDLFDGYTDDQLATIIDFLRRGTQKAIASVELLRQDDAGSTSG